MNLVQILRESPALASIPNIGDKRLTLIRKLGFLELNQYLKTNNVITRFKKNIDLTEVGKGNYTKTVSSMIRDLISHAIPNLLPAYQPEKIRGQNSFSITFILPDIEERIGPFRQVVSNLRDLGILHYLDYDLRRNRAFYLQINYGRLRLLSQDYFPPIELDDFVEGLRGLRAALQACSPSIFEAPVETPVAVHAPVVELTPPPAIEPPRTVQPTVETARAPDFMVNVNGIAEEPVTRIIFDTMEIADAAPPERRNLNRRIPLVRIDREE